MRQKGGITVTSLSSFQSENEYTIDRLFKRMLLERNGHFTY